MFSTLSVILYGVLGWVWVELACSGAVLDMKAFAAK